MTVPSTMENDKVFRLLKNIAELQATIQNLKTKIDTISRWLHSKFDILPEDIKDVLSYDEFCTDEIVNNETSDTSRICEENWIAVTPRSKLDEKTDISNDLDNESESENAPNIKEEDIEIKDENISENDYEIDPLGGLSPSYSVSENDANNYIESKLRSTNSTGSVKYQLTKTLVVQLHDIYKTKSLNLKTYVQDSTRKRKEHQSLLQKPNQNIFLEKSKSGDFSYANEIFMCDKCRKEFPTELGLKNHKRKSHGQNKPFHCHYNDCKRTFTFRGGFITHLRKCHPDYDFARKKTKETKAPIYKCPFKNCNKLYSNKISFSRHLKRENHFAEQSGDKFEDSSRRCQKCLHCFATEEEFSVHTSQCGFCCELCNKVYNSKPALFSHLESHGNTFKCSFNNCGKILSSTKALVQHKKRHLIEIQPESTKSENTRKNIEPQPDENSQSKDSEERPNDTSDYPNAIVCRKCGKDCKTREALNEHILSNCYKCKTCKKTFVFKREQNEHLTQCMEMDSKTKKKTRRVNIKSLLGKIVSDKPFCKICSLNFTVQSDFEDHMAEHTIKLFTCPHAGCKRKFPTEEQLGEHEIKLHCRSCPNSFPHSAHFKLHNEKTHGGHALCSTFEELSKYTTETNNSNIRNFVMGFQCAKCRRVFETLQTMINHVERGCIGCKTCGHVFLSKSALEIHIKIVHKREKSFLCNSCGKSFVTKNILLRHMESWHSSHKKQFKCMSCDKIFMSLPGYLKHVKLHDDGGLKREQCDICGFDFANANTLKKHIEGIHENQRRFPCHLCEKRFKTTTHRKIHLKTHENPNGRKRGLNKDVDGLIAAAKRRKLK